VCGTTSISEVPADLARYYPTDYYPLPSSQDELARTAQHETYKIDIVTHYAGGGRLLEIGPGAGGFAHLARTAGFDVETMEMDERTCSFMREVVGVRAMQTSEPQTALRSAGPFHVIALWHVLEHLPDPRDLLQSAARALMSGGVLVIAVPNPRALQFGVFGRYWAHLDAPRHLALVPADAIVKSATSDGLEVVLQTSTDVGGLGWNAFGWEMSLRNLVPGLPSIFGRAATRLMRPVERRDLNGATYTLVLRKPAAR
jgi:SAM-dependent methyltransferase